jgi:Uri superfamily endonuclease
LIRYSPGTYILKLSLAQKRHIKIGQLGRYSFQPGTYLYFGSAFGPGGVAARIRHHLSVGATRHWHCDYLTPYCQFEAVYFCYAPHKLECCWTQTIENLSWTSSPIAGFGSSDCKEHCRSHLVYILDSAESTIHARILRALASQTPKWQIYTHHGAGAKQANDHC